MLFAITVYKFETRTKNYSGIEFMKNVGEAGLSSLLQTDVGASAVAAAN